MSATNQTNLDDLTTAQLRAIAYEADQNRNHPLAAAAYQKAVDVYPVQFGKSAMGLADIAALTAKAKSSRAIAAAQVADQSEADSAPNNRPQDGRVCNCEDAPCCGCYA